MMSLPVRKPSFRGLKLIASRRLFGLFHELRGRTFAFVEPGGNYGDELIYLGAEKLALAAGLRFVKMSFSQYMNMQLEEYQAIYIHGGGGCVPWWSGTPRLALLRALKCHAGITILGPQTFWTDTLYLSRFFDGIHQSACEKVYIFARDIVSFEAITCHLPPFVEAFLDHDTALNLSQDDFDAPANEERGHLLSFRRDKESASPDYPKPESLDPVLTCGNFGEWMRLHSSARTIVTDRLHSAIAGSVAKVPVTLTANSYFKNRAVWEFSLKTRGVTWSDEAIAPSELPRVAYACRGGFPRGGHPRGIASTLTPAEKPLANPAHLQA